MTHRRVEVPVIARVEGEEVVLSKGFEKCVFLYDKTDWEKEWEKQIDNPITDAKTRQLKRYVFSGAVSAVLDDQGRVVVPQALRTYAGLEKEVVVIGAGDHMELWDRLTWESHLNKISSELEG